MEYPALSRRCGLFSDALATDADGVYCESEKSQQLRSVPRRRLCSQAGEAVTPGHAVLVAALLVGLLGFETCGRFKPVKRVALAVVVVWPVVAIVNV